MQKPKLRVEQIWPKRRTSARPASKGTVAEPLQLEQSPAKGGQPRPLADRNPCLTPRSKGSYYLRKGWDMLVRSVYLTRVIERLEQEYRESGEHFLSGTSIVWVSGDGCYKRTLNSQALRQLLTHGR